MYPLLAQIGSIPIHTYGMMIAIGFILAVLIGARLAAQSGLDVERVLDLGFWCFVLGFVGARLYYVATQWDYFSSDPAAIFRVWEGGLVFYGGPIVALPFGVWYLRKYKMKIWQVIDVFVPSLTIAHMFGRLGCLGAGCCYGKPTGTSFGLRFYSDQVASHFHGVLLHPTQLYEASGLLVLFLGLLWIYKNRQFEGQVALTYFIVYPIIRSVVEVFRGDQIRGFVIEGWMSWGQFTSLIVFVLASVALFLRLRKLRELKS